METRTVPERLSQSPKKAASPAAAKTAAGPLRQAHSHSRTVAAHAHQDQRAQAVFLQTDPEVHAVRPHVDVVLLAQVTPPEGPVLLLPGRSHPQGDRPDTSSPSSAPSASLKSPVDRPRRYSTGSTSSTFGDRRLYGGRIELVKRRPDLRSSTRGACASTVPAPVVTWRDRAWPLRTARARPSSPALRAVSLHVLGDLGLQGFHLHPACDLVKRIRTLIPELYALNRHLFGEHS